MFYDPNSFRLGALSLGFEVGKFKFTEFLRRNFVLVKDGGKILINFSCITLSLEKLKSQDPGVLFPRGMSTSIDQRVTFVLPAILVPEILHS